MEYRDHAGKPIIAGQPLSTDQLKADFSKLPVATDDKLAPGGAYLVGQDRARAALELAVGIRRRGFNVYVSGRSGHGRHTLVRAIAKKEAENRPAPSDWVYLDNLTDPAKPVALELPAGRAIPFKQAMEELIDDLANDIPARFEGEEYQTKRRSIEQEYAEAHEKAFNEIVELADERGLVLLRTPMGFMVAAEKDGKPLKPEEFRALPEDKQARIDEDISTVQADLERVLKEIPQREKQHRRAIEALNAEIARQSVDAALAEVEQEFGSLPGIQAHLDRIRSDLTENASLFLIDERTPQAGAFPVATTKHYQKPQFARYSVNAIIAKRETDHEGAPVIEEALPTLSNLLGRIEYESEMGALITDFTMIKPGALHRANGGFLILDVYDVLGEPFAWEGLKRCLKSRQITITSAQERLSLMTTTSLEPDPIPLDLKIILIGERLIFLLLAYFDPEFSELFKVQADFEDELPVSQNGSAAFAGLLRYWNEHEDLLKLQESAVKRLLEEASRMAEDALKLSLNLERLLAIVTEADFMARSQGRKEIAETDIALAVTGREERAGRYREHLLEAIDRNILMVETQGHVAGQVNALSVVSMGDVEFGRPSRLTATVRSGRGKLVDIEREVELGGPLHSKGVMILSGYLASRYAQDYPLSLSASLVFEQSYSGIDGDSASAAELICLLSALSDAPINQAFAITGSVNQKGMIQAIGGVNQKIEGFFDICSKRGLTGEQGVLIPAANVQHLALRDRVIEAVASGKFRIIPIETVDDGLAILTGMPAGQREAGGSFPEGTINRQVEERLIRFAIGMRDFLSRDEKGAGEDERR